MAGLIFYYLDAKVSERMLHLTAESPRGGIGIRVRLRTVSRKGLQVQLLPGAHKQVTVYSNGFFSIGYKSGDL